MDNQTILNNTRYEVLTPDGWSDFDGLLVTQDKELYKLDNYDLECTDNHEILINGEFVSANELSKSYIKTDKVYDLLNVKKNNSYLTNNIVSHNCCYIDEAAFIPNDMQFYESTYPTISSGKESRIIMSTTPNGNRGMFYKLWKDSENQKNSYVNIKVPWHLVPGRDEAWKEETIQNTSKEQFRQEYECVTGESIISIKDDYGVYNMAIEDLHNILKELPEIENLKEVAEKREGVVYKITREDFKEYIGTSLNFKNRLFQHRISERFSEYGILDYEILYRGNYYNCLKLEPYFIEKFDTFHSGLNNSIDGKGNHLSPNFTTLGYKYTD